MLDLFEGRGPGPQIWNRLIQSGFFYADYEEGESTPSRFMAGLGYKGSDFLDGHFLTSIHPDDLPTYQGLWDRIGDGFEEEFFAEYRVKTTKGGYRWVQTFAVVLERSPTGRIAKLFGVDRDIGLRKRSESLLHSRFLDLERRFLMSESLRIAGSAVTASLDLDSTIPAILEQAGTLFPFTGARIWACQDDELELLGQEESPGSPDLYSPPTQTLALRVAQEKTPLIVDDLALRMKAECPGCHASWIGIPLLFQGEARGVMEYWNEEPGFFRSEHIWPAMAFADNVAVGLFNANQYQATREASETDPLTGLATRRRLERMGPELFRQARAQKEDLTVFMVDLDNFKLINDNYGHAQGDAVLRHFAQVCLSVLRKGDLICRYGGDEFVALLPQTNREEGSAVAHRLRDLFKSREFPFSNHKVSLSLGIATLGQGSHQELKTLMEEADAALYRVKAHGRDGIAVFTPQPSLPSWP